jgi:hypothetical protein
MDTKRLSARPRLLVMSLALLTACSSAGRDNLRPVQVGPACSEHEESCGVLQGYSGNAIADGVAGATISGGGHRASINQVTADFGTVGGGQGNLAGEGSTVAGGSGNIAQYFNATVGGGANNIADAQEATVGGGFKNTASQRWAVVGGGSVNSAAAIHATVCGGSGNIAGFTFATVAGGTQNLAGSTAAIVAGGEHNLAEGAFSSVLGGLNNEADGYLTSIGGGAGNLAAGSYAVVPGGFANQAGGDYSFAAGRTARVAAAHAGTFLFADSNPSPFSSAAQDEFAVRATGGVRFVTAIYAAGAPLSGVRLSQGSGAWENLSDSNLKAGFADVDPQQILDRLMSMPMSTWHYRGEDPSIRHIGPTAQDFHAAFSLGQDARYISTADADGVALAGIKALYRLLQQRPPASEAVLQHQIDSLQSRLFVSNALTAVSLGLAVLALLRRDRRFGNRRITPVRRYS